MRRWAGPKREGGAAEGGEGPEALRKRPGARPGGAVSNCSHSWQSPDISKCLERAHPRNQLEEGMRVREAPESGPFIPVPRTDPGTPLMTESLLGLCPLTLSLFKTSQIR